VVTPAAGKVVLVPFPFSDLSRSRLRPAVILADVGMGDGLLCQVTSNPYSDPAAVELTAADFQVGSLHRPNLSFRTTRPAPPARSGF
jgi:mRNA interferase MazF